MGRRHAENLRRLVPEAQLVAVADVAAARSREVAELEIEHSFASLEEMLGHKDIQSVLIATPDKFHARRSGLPLQPEKTSFKKIEAGKSGTPLIFKSVGRDKDEPPMASYQSRVNGMGLL